MNTWLHEDRRWLWLLVVAWIGLWLGGCGMGGNKPPAQLEVALHASADINPGPNGQPLPVRVRVYVLRGQGAFAGADFFSLFDREAATLGAELVARDEVVLSPGQSVPLVRGLDPAATHLGVAVGFRDIDHARWRALVALQPGRDNRVQVEVGARSVSARSR